MKTRLRLLFAEDNAHDIQMLQLALERVQVAFHHIVQDGAEVIDYLQQNDRYSNRQQFKQPNCLVLDLSMPRMDGFEVLKWINNHPEHKFLPRIVLTGHRSPDMVRRAYEFGANTVFFKTTRADATINLVQTIGNYWLNALLYEPKSDDITQLGLQ